MELRARFSLPDRLRHGAGLHDSLCRGIVHSSYRHPRAWLTVAGLAAGVGCAFLLFFPYLLVSSSTVIYPTLTSAHTPQQWLIAVSHICSLYIGAVFTYALFTLRFDPPAGRVLTKREAPALSGLVEQLRPSFGNPRIHRVMLDEGDDVRIVKTPRNGFPLLNTTTLVIGLPLLQTVSPQHFRVLLARRIGQLSLRHNAVGTALVHLKGVWPQYRNLRHRSSLPLRLIGHFFTLYAPVYDALTSGIGRREEMNADRYALDIINDQEIVEAVSFHAVSRDFLASRYWPTIRRMAARAHGIPDYLPYEHMTTVMRKGLTATALEAVVQRLFSEDDFRGGTPTLSDRLDNLGYSGPIPLQELKATAAQLLPESLSAAIVKAFHDRWLEQFAPNTQSP